MADTFHCTLVTPEAQLVDQPVEYASIPAWDGLMGIAPGRAPLLAKLTDGPLRLDLPSQPDSKWLFLGGGFAQMKDNKLTILASEAIDSDNLSPDDARAMIKEAEARIAVGEDEFADRQRQLQRGRAMLTIIHEA